MQQSVDTDSKIIVAVEVNDQPPDHYQLVNQIDNIENNLGKVPKIISADTIYRTPENIKKAKEKDITLLIPTRKQSKKMTNKINKKPYSKDQYKYNYKENTYTCPQKQKLTLKTITHNKNKPEILKYNYYTSKYKNCPVKNKCTKSNVRIIQDTIYEGEHELRKLMETPKAQKEYKKRSHTAEPSFDVLKQHKNLNKIPVTGKENVESRVILMATAYDLRVLLNKIKNRNNTDTLKNFSQELLQKTANHTYTLTFA